MPALKTTTKSTLKAGRSAGQNVQTVRFEPLKTLLEWQAPSRSFKRRSREFFTTAGAMVFLLIVIAAFMQEWLLIMVFIALAFYVYIMTTIEPHQVGHKITNRGIVTGGRTYRWEELGRFWFSKKFDQTILNVEILFRLPGRLILLLGGADQEQVKKILSQYLPHEEPEKTWVDNASDWLSRRVPLESSS